MASIALVMGICLPSSVLVSGITRSLSLRFTCDQRILRVSDRLIPDSFCHSMIWAMRGFFRLLASARTFAHSSGVKRLSLFLDLDCSVMDVRGLSSLANPHSLAARLYIFL